MTSVEGGRRFFKFGTRYKNFGDPKVNIENDAYVAFLSGVITLRHCPITSHVCQESCDFIGHCLKVMTPDKKGFLGIIFDIGCSKKIDHEV